MNADYGIDREIQAIDMPYQVIHDWKRDGDRAPLGHVEHVALEQDASIGDVRHQVGPGMAGRELMQFDPAVAQVTLALNLLNDDRAGDASRRQLPPQGFAGPGRGHDDRAGFRPRLQTRSVIAVMMGHDQMADFAVRKRLFDHGDLLLAERRAQRGPQGR